MTINEKQDDIINEFSMYDDWMEKYEYIIELGKDIPKIDTSKMDEEHLIHGCQSQVWVDAKVEDGKLFFEADSDAIITKGMIGLLIRVLSGEKPEDIVKADLYFIDKIGLHENLSPTRSNGLLGMIKKVRELALENLKQKYK